MSKKIPYTKTGDAEQDEKLMLPLSYIQQIPGKQIRSKLILAFNNWLQIPPNKLREVGEIVQMLHNASLLIDDIQDNSILRRGIPVAHSIYGVASTINAANYVIFAALERVLELGHAEGGAASSILLPFEGAQQAVLMAMLDKSYRHPTEALYKECHVLSATHVYTEQLLELHRGQGMEIYWRDNFICPAEDEYKQMTIRKTGGLFMLAIRLMQLFSDNKSDFTKLASILGLYFQIRDDYCNLWMREYSENKSYCEDLTEGKFSFPLIHAINKQPGDNQVLNILRQRTKNVEVKRYCISLLENLGSFQYTKETLESLDKEAREEVEQLGGNPLLISLLDDLLSWNDDTHTMKTTMEE